MMTLQVYEARDLYFPQKTPTKRLRNSSLMLSMRKKKKNHEAEIISAVNNQDVVNNLAHYLIRKELLVNRMSDFDDTAETYIGWKVTFKHIVDEMK
ncbi:hypothetical protein DPMN_050164 [Dreissena polymorpha]|uniref:Uncharacterized protein n=1 Tax=Dreissena polymorpha TaxID=45954 RepID=A0A9D4HP01_DREPO|nr:hypothetical protein DPMN_050164 [Dreissena polymorpha]